MLPRWLHGKESASNAGDSGLIPGSRTALEEGNGLSINQRDDVGSQVPQEAPLRFCGVTLIDSLDSLLAPVYGL